VINDESLERRYRDDDEDSEQTNDVVHDEEVDLDADEVYYEDDVDDDDEENDYDENDEEDRRHLYRRKKGFSWEEEDEREIGSLVDLGLDSEDDE
jgi:hypothetical protein